MRVRKNATHSHHEVKAGVKEEELIAAFEKVARKDYPNPARVGCPGKKVLERMMQSKRTDLQGIIDHVMKCAPCLEEYDELRRHITGR
jgi:hypothetical protein